MQGVNIWLGRKGGHVNVPCHLGLNKQMATQNVILSCLARGITIGVVKVGSGTVMCMELLGCCSAACKKITFFAQLHFAASLVGAKVSLNTNCWIALSFETASNGLVRIETGCRC